MSILLLVFSCQSNEATKPNTNFSKKASLAIIDTSDLEKDTLI